MMNLKENLVFLRAAASTSDVHIYIYCIVFRVEFQYYNELIIIATLYYINSKWPQKAYTLLHFNIHLTLLLHRPFFPSTLENVIYKYMAQTLFTLSLSLLFHWLFLAFDIFRINFCIINGHFKTHLLISCCLIISSFQVYIKHGYRNIWSLCLPKSLICKI